MEHATALFDRFMHGVDTGKYKTMDPRGMNSKEATIAIVGMGKWQRVTASMTGGCRCAVALSHALAASAKLHDLCAW